MRRAAITLLLSHLLVAFTPIGAAAHEGWGIVVDSQRRVYVTDIPRNIIWRFSRDGIAPVARDVHSHSLTMLAGDRLVGTHVHLTRPLRYVWLLDHSGRLAEVVPPFEGEGLGLQSFLLANDGSIYSASLFQPDVPPESRILLLLRRRPDGMVDTVAGGLRGHADGEGRNARFSAIDGMAWLPDGSIVMADGPRVRRVTTEGMVETLDSHLTTTRWGEDLLGVSAGPDGAIYAADFSGRRLWMLDGSDRSVLSGPAAFWAPSGVFVTADADIYLLEHPRAPFSILGDLGVGPYLRVRHRTGGGEWAVLGTRWGRQTAAAASSVIVLGLAGLAIVAVRRSSRSVRDRR